MKGKKSTIILSSSSTASVYVNKNSNPEIYTPRKTTKSWSSPHDGGDGGGISPYRSCPARCETPPHGKGCWWPPSDRNHTHPPPPLAAAWTVGGLGTSPAPQTSAAPLLDPPRLQDNLLVCPAPPSCYAAGCDGEYEENGGWNLEGAFLRSPSIYTKKKLTKTLIVLVFAICYKKKEMKEKRGKGFGSRPERTRLKREREESERDVGILVMVEGCVW